MRLVIALEQHFLRSPDGRIWTATDLGRSYWDRYLGVFDDVRVVARTRDVAAVEPGWVRVDGAGVSVAAVPDFVGPLGFLRAIWRVRSAVSAELHGGDAFILRVPGTIGTMAAGILLRRGQPFGVEVVGDPHDVFAPGVVSHPLRPLIRWWFTHNLRRQSRAAAATLHVTREALQRRYPPGARCSLAVGASDVDLPDAAFLDSPEARRERPLGRGSRFRILSVGSMAQRYKGHDLTIAALRECREAGLDLELVIVGDGKERPELERLAARLGVQSHVTFRGLLPAGDAVRRELDDAHLFVMASRVEGLPRALVEAMARGLPSLGTAVGGIPELLPAEALVPSEDAAALAARIRALVADAALRGERSRLAWETARGYRKAALQPRREAFYRVVAAAARAWADRRRGVVAPLAARVFAAAPRRAVAVARPRLARTFRQRGRRS